MAQPTSHNAYLPGYAANQIQHHEWRTAENSAAYLLPSLKDLSTTNPIPTLLDVGAGSGTISASLAKYLPQGGQVLATDLSPEILERARSHATQAGVTNIRFQQASVYALPFADASFDVVHASMVLCHLDAPVQALAEMLRVAKPGGLVADRESDLRMWSYHPQLPGIDKSLKLLRATHEAAGGSVDGGARLVSWAMKAGARREQITASFGTWCYSTPEERRVWGEFSIVLLAFGYFGVLCLDDC